MINGAFCDYSKNENYISGTVIKHFKEFLGTNFDELRITIESSVTKKRIVRIFNKVYANTFRRF